MKLQVNINKILEFLLIKFSFFLLMILNSLLTIYIIIFVMAIFKILILGHIDKNL